ncbi:MAG TPA: hypothetical protein VHZ24_05165 [Pirellulales bacterium]|nr:hypothetical protein [Pirellulales bacterium]
MPASAMSQARTKADVLDREFLEMRAKILELAASLDRLDRASGALPDDPRAARLVRGLTALQDKSSARAEEVQMIFSQAYDDAWRKKFGV